MLSVRRIAPSTRLQQLADGGQWQEQFQGCFFQADKAKTLVIGFGGFILGIDE